MSANVLLVEDEVVTAKYFKRVMEKHGIEVDWYDSLKELKEHYQDLRKYKTVFVDLRLDKFGWKSYGKDILNEMLEISDYPFYVVWSAFGNNCPDAHECLKMGASLIMTKDGNMEALANIVKHINKNWTPEVAELGNHS